MTEDIKKRIENSNKLADQLERTGGILDIGALYEGAEKAEAERAEHQRKIREEAHAQQLKKQAEAKAFMDKVSKHVHKEKETKANEEVKLAKAKAEKELEAEIRKRNGLMSAEEEEKHNALKNMLGNLNL
ncbi:hypothetical protein G7058_03840 [Jeotgalibaca porci]|uniref:DUF4355 domain-containing protein n=1 Tax=Jeotgalibaca porci TaxID=1868793 RepID=A0A6G7WG74_9LACT|nr:hypothetical protein [Jeotgalibaca porci]QIK51264.1 hypothetical protein G7058_03840 [Jeotgalibaca porci]